MTDTAICVFCESGDHENPLFDARVCRCGCACHVKLTTAEKEMIAASARAYVENHAEEWDRQLLEWYSSTILRNYEESNGLLPSTASAAPTASALDRPARDVYGIARTSRGFGCCLARFAIEVTVG